MGGATCSSGALTITVTFKGNLVCPSGSFNNGGSCKTCRSCSSSQVQASPCTTTSVRRAVTHVRLILATGSNMPVVLIWSVCFRRCLQDLPDLPKWSSSSECMHHHICKWQAAKALLIPCRTEPAKLAQAASTSVGGLVELAAHAPALRSKPWPVLPSRYA